MRIDSGWFAIAEIGQQPLVGPGKVFGQNPGFGDDGKEICVSGPAGQHMHVQVISNPCARHPAQVEAHVETFGMILALERSLAVPGGFEEAVESGIAASPKEEMCRLAARSRCPLVYGNRFRRTNSALPRKRTKFSPSFSGSAKIRQKTQRVSAGSILLM